MLRISLGVLNGLMNIAEHRLDQIRFGMYAREA
jgi:hypothetical protein